LAKLVRGKLKALLGRCRPDLVLPASVWRKPWVVHITSWGAGEQAVLDYLARYVFRVAITDARLVGLDEHAVTIRYKQRKSARWRTCRIPGEEFMRRFLQHVLPNGFHKSLPRRKPGCATSVCGTRPIVNWRPGSACGWRSTSLNRPPLQAPRMSLQPSVILPPARADQRKRPPARIATPAISC
jgi:hypothetical protein